MGKLQVRLQEQREQFADIFRRYRVTIVAAGLICLVNMVYNIADAETGDVHKYIVGICALMAVGSFFAESLLSLLLQKRANKGGGKHDLAIYAITGYVLSLILAVFWTVLLINAGDTVSDAAYDAMYRIAAFYVSALILGGLYLTVNAAGLSLGAYGRNVIFNLLRLFFVLLAVNIGLLLVFFLFDSLIASFDVWDWLENMELLLSAVVYIPMALMYAADTESQRVHMQSIQSRCTHKQNIQQHNTWEQDVQLQDTQSQGIHEQNVQPQNIQLQNVQSQNMQSQYVQSAQGVQAPVSSGTGDSKFVKAFLRFALMPLVCAATIIIYMYMIKVLVGMTEISNVIFSPCMYLFILGAPIWEMAGKYNTDSGNKEYDNPGYAGENFGDVKNTHNEKVTFWDKIISRMPYIYAPFILLEIYSIASRIAEYGLTPDRYGAVLFIVFQIIYVVWCAVCGRIQRKSSATDSKTQYTPHIAENTVGIYDGRLTKSITNKSGLFLVAIVLLFIALVVPFINVEYASYASQKRRFDKSYKEAREILSKYDYAYSDEQSSDAEMTYDLTDDEEETLKRFTGAYDYLRYDARGESYVKSDKSGGQVAADVDSAKSMMNPTGDYSGSFSCLAFYINDSSAALDISGGYNWIYEVSQSQGSSEESAGYYENYTLYYGEDDENSVQVDLSDIMYELENIGYHGYIHDSEPYEIQIDSTKKLILTTFRVYKQDYGNSYKNLYIDGYLLEK